MAARRGFLLGLMKAAAVPAISSVALRPSAVKAAPVVLPTPKDVELFGQPAASPFRVTDLEVRSGVDYGWFRPSWYGDDKDVVRIMEENFPNAKVLQGQSVISVKARPTDAKMQQMVGVPTTYKVRTKYGSYTFPGILDRLYWSPERGAEGRVESIAHAGDPIFFDETDVFDGLDLSIGRSVKRG